MEDTRREFLQKILLGAAGAMLPKKARAGTPTSAVIEGKPPEAIQLTCLEDSLPDFPLWDKDGKKYNMSSFYGKPILLNFWATYCKPCVQEIPLLNELSGEIRILGICAPADLLNERYIHPGSKTIPDIANGPIVRTMRFQTLYISLEVLTAVSDCYYATYKSPIVFPTFILVGSNGKITFTIQGSLRDAKNYQSLQKALHKTY